MAAEAGHQPNRAYHDLAGDVHLNNANLWDQGELALAQKATFTPAQGAANITPLQFNIENGQLQRSVRQITPSADGVNGPVRQDRRNELFVENLWNSLHALAEEGSLFVAQTPTPGTGIVLTSATGQTFADT